MSTPGPSFPSVPASSSHPGLRRGPPSISPAEPSSRNAPYSGEGWSVSPAFDHRFRAGSFGSAHADWGVPAAIAYGSPRRAPTPLGWSHQSGRLESSAFHVNYHLLGQQAASYGNYRPSIDSSYAFHPSDPYLRPPTPSLPGASPQAIFSDSQSFGSHLPVAPPSPVASVGDNDDEPSRQPVGMGFGDPWTFQHVPAQPFAYPSSSLRRGAARVEPDCPPTEDFDDDEAEINHYLSGARSPPRLLMSSLVSRAPSPSPTSSLPSLTYSASDRSAVPGPLTSGGSSTSSPPATGAIGRTTSGGGRTSSSTPSPTAPPPATIEGRRKRTRAEAASSVASSSAIPSSSTTMTKRSRADEQLFAPRPTLRTKRIKAKAGPAPLVSVASPASTMALAPAASKSGRRRGKAPSSCAECRRLKMRCNLKEQQPCSSCVARGCPTVCPNGVLANMSGKRLVLADTEALHARITALEAALAVSFAREDPTLEPISDQEQPDVFDAEGRRVHPLLLAAFVDGGGAPAQEGQAEAGEVLTDGDSS